MHHVSLLMYAKFEGNPITSLRFIVFCRCVKRKRKIRRKRSKKEKMSKFLKAQMAGVIYFRSGMFSPLICQYLHSKFGAVRTRDHRATNMHKIILCSSCMLCTHAPFSWAARYTTVSLDSHNESGVLLKRCIYT